MTFVIRVPLLAYQSQVHYEVFLLFFLEKGCDVSYMKLISPFESSSIGKRVFS